MSKKETQKEKIINKAVEIIKSFPKGIRYSELVREIHQQFPSIPIKSIPATVWDLDTSLPDEIYKPTCGLFRHTAFREVQAGESESKVSIEIEKVKKVKEEDFYQLFADWLVKELEECTKAIPLGGSKFKDKWGTPDIIGIREPRKSDIIKPLTEIVSTGI